jgi:DNA ligase-1
MAAAPSVGGIGQDGGVEFADLAATSAAVAATSARRSKVDLLAGCLRRLADPANGGADPVAVAAGAAYLSGELRQRQTGVGWASVRETPPAAAEPSLTVGVVDALLEQISRLAGAGSQGERRRLLHQLYSAATVDEQRFLTALLTGELRQGAQVGLLVDAVARAAQVTPTLVRRALLLAGDVKAVAVAALTGGAAELEAFQLTVGRPLAPMLAQSAPSVSAAMEATGSPAAADVKIDGVRVQVHRDGTDIAVFSRSLDDLTARVPGVVAAARALPLTSAVLDGEAVGVDAAGRPIPFQETSSRAARQARGDDPPTTGLRPFFFDLLHVDGVNLLDEPASQRWAALDAVTPSHLRVGRTMVTNAEEASTAFAAAVDAGQEGLVIKAVGSPYDVGRRGSAWVKVKPRHTLDLVVLAVEWGHGRRRGWLSNLHLGARDPQAGGFVMLGKTFKGLTDEMLRWQTERLRGLAIEESDWVVRVRPELVVEIAFDGVQASTRYPGGVALRFARVLRSRADKHADEADTIGAVQAIHTGWVAAQ